ncbi:MAG TPA: CpsB/CapC family capsule biosynthesis tyrosine phosphatase [Thermoanaerobaculia bacterium]|nr:CpsB/CapC family capsule biosynthesis tyrosine phosphatase [Thermoanaerobaculia bacterium]
MIDIHHHCLPGVDDGPSDWDEAVAQCRLAASEGIDTIIATPHVLRGPWRNDSRRELQKLTLELNRRLETSGPRPRIILGSEYYFAHDILEVLESEEGIVPLAGSRWVLVEFASTSVPPRIPEVFYEMRIRGWNPVIAHPERNFVFQQKMSLLHELIEQGARLQLTLSSLTGAFGTAARRAAFGMMDHQMVHFLATDAHDLRRRPPSTGPGRELVTERWGAERWQRLTVDNPSAIVEQRPLPYEPEPVQPAQTGGFLGFLGKLWR